MKPEKETVDATLRSSNRVERSVHLLFIALVIVVLLTLEIFAMTRVEDQSKTIIKSKPTETSIQSFGDIDFGFELGYEGDSE